VGPTHTQVQFVKLTMAEKSDRGIYLLGVGLGVCAGFLDVKIGDLLLTALFVLAASMLLGALRPQRPWRWTLTVAAFVPLVQLAAFALLTEKPDRAQIYESFLGFLTGIAGAYGGATARRGLSELFGK
jgi:energy-converting hydrogenase Eha subunit A